MLNAIDAADLHKKIDDNTSTVAKKEKSISWFIKYPAFNQKN